MSEITIGKYLWMVSVIGAEVHDLQEEMGFDIPAPRLNTPELVLVIGTRFLPDGRYVYDVKRLNGKDFYGLNCDELFPKIGPAYNQYVKLQQVCV